MKNYITVGLFGSQYHIEVLKKQFEQFSSEIRVLNLNKELLKNSSIIQVYKALRQVDVIHGFSTYRFFKVFAMAKLLRKKTICHWIGTDVLTANETLRDKIWAKAVSFFVDVNLVGAPWLGEELKALNIRSFFVPLASDIADFNQEKLPSFPSVPAVLSYVPDEKANFYGLDIILKLAKELPEVKFMVVSGKGKGISFVPKNLIFLGWQENMREVYSQCNVFLRIPLHDGLSLSVLDALLLGRQVVWTNNFPHCYYTKRNYGDIKSTLQKALSNKNLNMQAVSYIKKRFHFKIIINELLQIYKS